MRLTEENNQVQKHVHTVVLQKYETPGKIRLRHKPSCAKEENGEM